MAVKNKYKIERKYITNSKARSKQKSNVKFLVSHETANNNADASDHYNYFQGITFQASAHTFIDDGKILEIIPLEEKAWHVMYNQDKRVLGLGYANDNAIGTELCRTGNFKKSYARYVWYHAHLCKKYGLQPGNHIVSHKVLDPQRRTDPQSWLNPNGVTWDKFINDVQYDFDNWNKKTASKPSSKAYTQDAKYPKLENYGANVKKIQSQLSRSGYAIDVDSSFGPATDKAIRSFQSENNLAVDGQAGPKTQRKLKKQVSTNLEIDGYEGKQTIKAEQKYFGTPVDGFISKPSLVVKKRQKLLGVKQDGFAGPKTIRAEQTRYGTIVDGFISKPSTMIKERQRRLNKGKL